MERIETVEFTNMCMIRDNKGNVLAQEMGHQMDELVEQLRDVNLQEQKVRQERKTLAEIRSDLVE